MEKYFPVHVFLKCEFHQEDLARMDFYQMKCGTTVNFTAHFINSYVIRQNEWLLKTAKRENISHSEYLIFHY